MTHLAALILLLVSLWFYSIIAGLSHLLPDLSNVSLWIWLGLGAAVLSWLIKDS